VVWEDKGGLPQPLKRGVVWEDKGGLPQPLKRGVVWEDKGGLPQNRGATFTVNPNAVKDFERLLQNIITTATLPLQQIIHLWSLDIAPATHLTPETLAEAQLWGCGSSLHLLQALLSQEIPSVKLWGVTRGAVSLDDTPCHVAQASLWGLGRVMALEHPQLWGGLIDLSSDATVADATTILQEIEGSQGENQIALRGGKRYGLRLVEAKPTISQTFNFNSEATYLITGGLGALGLQVAQWLARQGVQHLVLSGRRGLDDPKAAEAVSQLEKAGVQVLVVKGDISQEADALHLIEKIQYSLPPLRGIIHAAGVLDDGLLSQQTWERFQAVMPPKVAGAWHLHCLTQDIPLDFLVCFSSIAALVGSPGQGNYAAANAFLDALAHYRQQLGLPGLSLNWGPWSQAGMAAGLKISTQERLAARGMKLIEPETGLQLFGQLFGQNQPQIAVLPVNWVKFQQKLPPGVKMPLLAAWDKPETSATVSQSPILEQLKTIATNEQLTVLTQYVRTQVAQILKCSSIEQVGLQQGLFELGMDSLMAMELKQQLEADLNCAIPATVAFDYPTVEALVSYLATELKTIAVKQDCPPPSATETVTVVSQSDVELKTIAVKQDFSQPSPVERSSVRSQSNVDELSDSEAEALLLKTLETLNY
jgi:NADP-dependent 3-hydroxy acid dehydrogenase YdfG/acyl carrier protein